MSDGARKNHDALAIGAELLTRFDFPAQSCYRLAGIGVSNFIDEDDDEEPVKVQPESHTVAREGALNKLSPALGAG